MAGNSRGLDRSSWGDRGGTVGHSRLAVVAPGDRLQAVEPDRLTLCHPWLIASHRDLDHLSALGVLGEHLDNPLRAAGVAIDLLLGLAVVPPWLGGPWSP